jgi:hypothetical protein
MFALMVAGAAVIVLIPGAPLGLITEAVQAVAGVLLPSASMFLLLLCNDPAVLGPWRNGVKLNVFATIIEAVLILLSLILMATTLFPHLNATLLSEIGGAVLATILVVAGVGYLVGPAPRCRGHHDRDRAGLAQGSVDDAAAGAAVSAPRLHRAKADDVQHGGVPFAGRGHADRQGHRTWCELVELAREPVGLACGTTAGQARAAWVNPSTVHLGLTRTRVSFEGSFLFPGTSHVHLDSDRR